LTKTNQQLLAVNEHLLADQNTNARAIFKNSVRLQAQVQMLQGGTPFRLPLFSPPAPAAGGGFEAGVQRCLRVLLLVVASKREVQRCLRVLLVLVASKRETQRLLFEVAAP
jgi:hypothetical protein